MLEVGVRLSLKDRQQYSSGMSTAAKDTDKFGDSTRKAGKEADHSVHALDRMRSAASRVGHGMAAAGGAVLTAAKRSLLGVAAVGAVAGGAIYKIGAAYSDSMNSFQAVTKATGAQMTAVGKQATALGADMTLPATSAAGAMEAMTELAKAGLSVKDSMAAGLGTLQLATAGNMSEADAATAAANALNTFGLHGDQATRVANALANAANISSGEVSDFALGMAQGGLVAHQTGLSLEQTAGALSLFANNGLQGADAGTSLKTMLSRLVPQTKAATNAMHQYGLSFVDQHGKYKDLSNVAEQLKTKLGGLSDKQRSAALYTIFGSDAIRAATLFMGAGATGVDKYTKAVGRAGGAAEVAAAKSKGLPGALRGLRSQFETIAIGIYNAVDKPLEHVVRRVADVIPQVQDRISKAWTLARHGAPKQTGKLDRLDGTQPSNLAQAGMALGLSPDMAVRAAQAIRKLQDALRAFLPHLRNLRSEAGPQLGQMVHSLGSFAPLATKGLHLLGTTLAFLARHASTVAKIALPLLIAGLIAYKAKQASATAVAILDLPVRALELVALLASASANRALAFQLSVLTGVQQTSRLAVLKSIVVWVAQKVAMVAVAIATRAWSAAVRIATAVQWAWNAAMTANPIGLIIVAIGALVIGLVIAWKKSETFRTIVITAFRLVAKGVLTYISTVLLVIQKMMEGLGHLPGKLGAPFRAAAKAIGFVRDKLQTVKDKLDELGRTKTVVKIDVQGAGALQQSRAAATGIGGRMTVEARAAGGPVRQGVPYQVNEHGPEIFVPEQNGRVLDANTSAQLMQGGGGPREVHLHMQPGAVVINEARDGREAYRLVGKELEDVLARR